jgi:hypothetical protein
MQTPSLPVSVRSTSSGTFRGTSQTARADEWLKITGALVTRSACRIVSAETCDRSTSMPIRFISRTTSSPKSLSPPSTGTSVAESAQETLSLWVSVMYRTPSSRITRRTPSDSPIE